MFDTHCHLDCLDINVVEQLRNSAANDELLACISIGLRADTFEKMYEQTSNLSNIWYTVGNHPTEEFVVEPEINSLANFIKLDKVVAIGETGLDYFHKNVPVNIQRRRFEMQIELALEYNKPIVIHCRDALDDVLSILKSYGARNFVMHCFTGGPEDAENCLEMGAFISYSGIVTFKNAKANQEAAKITPLDRLLIETDSPYLAPVPYRGKPNHPGLVRHVAYQIAVLKELPVADIAKITTENACNFFDVSLEAKAFN